MSIFGIETNGSRLRRWIFLHIAIAWMIGCLIIVVRIETGQVKAAQQTPLGERIVELKGKIESNEKQLVDLKESLKSLNVGPRLAVLETQAKTREENQRLLYGALGGVGLLVLEMIFRFVISLRRTRENNRQKPGDKGGMI
jgi:hypothetical protein